MLSPIGARWVCYSAGAGLVLCTPVGLVTVADYDDDDKRPRWRWAEAWARTRSGGWHLYGPAGVNTPSWDDRRYRRLSRRRGHWQERPVEVEWVSAHASDAVRRHCAAMLTFVANVATVEVTWLQP